LTLISSTVSGNTALNAGGGISNISGYGSLTLTNSTVSGNSTVDGDTAAIGSGGGIIHFSVYGNLTLTNSTVSGNTARGGGGGIYSTVHHGTIALINSTVSGNIASDRSGGGISSYTYYFGNMTLTNSTVSDNRASLGGAGVYTGGYGWGTTAVTNTIIGDNQGSTPNCHGVLVLDSLGYNLTDDDSCGFTEHSDLVVNNVGLGRLQDNGGPTETHDLLTNSPAIDAGGNCPPPATDQRGVPRPQGAACDIGSVEYLPEPRRLLALIVGTGIIGFLHRRKR
jgi:predicted outer membrane repeat protein